MEKFNQLKSQIVEAKEKQRKEKQLADNHNELVGKIVAVGETVGRLKDATLKVSVENQKEFPREIKVNNLGDIEFPHEIKITNLGEIPKPKDEIALKQPKWFTFKAITDKFDELIKAVTGRKEIDPDKYTRKQNAIAVRLVDKDLGNFYNAGGGSGNNGVPTDANGNVKVSVQNGITIDTGDLEIGAVEIKNATDDTRATVGANGLYVVNRSGMFLPLHDTQEIDESLAPATTTIVYKLSGVTVATKTITVAGTDTTISMTYP